ncbi:tRNA lysidine(34) synthetase TilS [Chryseobacterium koreense]
MLTNKLFEAELSRLLPGFQEQSFLLAVSGGADSMVLLHLFKVAGLKFEVAHLNYKLRNEDSDLDQKVVQDFCSKNKIELHLYPVSEKDQKPENSIQLWARNLRYKVFRKIQQERDLEFLATAHHLNDELETFLINLSRGSGIKGLSGIPSSENKVIRPLLHFSKAEIYDFAEENGIEFREDLSNQKNDYLRNGFRNQVVAQIQKVSPNFLNGFKDSIHYLSEANDFIQHEIEKVLQEIAIKNNDGKITLNRKELLSKPDFILKEIIRKFGFSGGEIEKVISAENGKFFRSKTHELHISREEILCVERKIK